MKPLFFLKTVALVTTLFALAGCIIVINQPSKEEKELMAIQDTVGKQVTEISQKIATTGLTQPQINELITGAENYIDQGIQKINELKISEKTKAFALDTKKHLEEAKKVFGEIRQTFSNMDKLKSEATKLGKETTQAINDQLRSAKQLILGLRGELNGLVTEINSIKKQLGSPSSIP